MLKFTFVLFTFSLTLSLGKIKFNRPSNACVYGKNLLNFSVLCVKPKSITELHIHDFIHVPQICHTSITDPAIMDCTTQIGLPSAPEFFMLLVDVNTPLEDINI